MHHPNKYQEIVDGLKANTFTNITFLAGPGISTPAGVPDFRSLDPSLIPAFFEYNIEDPLDLFDLKKFLEDPKPFYAFCKYFDIENKKPTLSHLFMGFLSKKNLVQNVYTQNIDALELKAGIPEDKIVFAHGRVNVAECPKCKTEVDISELRNNYIMQDKIRYCQKCNTPVKPKVTFYHEELPPSFYESFAGIGNTDLCFILGNDLGIAPFNSLPEEIPHNAWRVLVNEEEAEGFEFEDPDVTDLFLKGNPDGLIEKLVKDVGWEEEFKQYCDQVLAACG